FEPVFVFIFDIDAGDGQAWTDRQLEGQTGLACREQEVCDAGDVRVARVQQQRGEGEALLEGEREHIAVVERLSERYADRRRGTVQLHALGAERPIRADFTRVDQRAARRHE